MTESSFATWSEVLAKLGSYSSTDWEAGPISLDVDISKGLVPGS